jgi:hypothetical protein
MSDQDRNITDEDAAAIAAAIAANDPAKRLESGKRTIGAQLRADRLAKRARTESRVLGRINHPAPAVGDE